MNEYARNGHEYMTILYKHFEIIFVPKCECVARCKRSACDPGQGWIVCACGPFHIGADRFNASTLQLRSIFYAFGWFGLFFGGLFVDISIHLAGHFAIR